MREDREGVAPGAGRHAWMVALLGLGLGLLLGLLPGGVGAVERLPVLARVGPWPVASQLIEFQGRLWLVNSVKGRNHNAADLYSYDPAAGDLRYERRLFSQDTGRPVVADGLLYWPFEDARSSLGVGEFAVTDGTRWTLGVIPGGRIFHTHAMAARGDALVAATSAWRAGLQLSSDRGLSWRAVYDHPTPEGQVSRIVELAVLDHLVLGPLSSRQAQRLLVYDGQTVGEVPGWPTGRAVLGLASFSGALHGLVGEPGGVGLWRTDGRASRRAGGWPQDASVDALAAGREGLWAAGTDRAGGAVWRSPDGLAWRLAFRLEGGRPHDLTVVGEAPFVAGAGDDGLGILWGPPIGAAPAEPVQPPAEDALAGWRPGAATLDWTQAGARLDRALADAASYRAPGRPLVDLVLRLARGGPPPGFFARRLDAAMPTEPLALIGGQVRVPAARLGRWILLWGMALAGEGQVPPALIAAPWSAPANPSEKYFEPAPAAMRAAALAGQDDRATIAALVARLDRSDDPPWLTGDVIGALSALTGQRLGYDLAAWRAWWRTAAPDWPG